MASWPVYGEGLWLKETVKVDVFRGHRGYYLNEPDEKPEVQDLIPTSGRQFIARRIAGGDAQTAPGSIMGWMAIGSGTTTPALTDGSTPGLYGEFKRLALTINSAGPTAVNVYTAVRTFGGASDTIQSISITEAGIFNHVGSGQGALLQRVTFAAVILADSDILRLQLETNVGSS